MPVAFGSVPKQDTRFDFTSSMAALLRQACPGWRIWYSEQNGWWCAFREGGFCELADDGRSPFVWASEIPALINEIDAQAALDLAMLCPDRTIWRDPDGQWHAHSTGLPALCALTAAQLVADVRRQRNAA